MRVARSAGFALLALLVLIVGFLVYFRYHGAGWLSRKVRQEKWRTGWREKIAVLLEGFSDGLQGVRTWEDMAVLLAYTAVHWVGVIVAYWCVAHAFGGELLALNFTAATLVLAFTVVGSAAQLPAVGGGAQAATFFRAYADVRHQQGACRHHGDCGVAGHVCFLLDRGASSAFS